MTDEFRETKPPAGSLLIFSHGLDSSPSAIKIGALRPIAERHGWRTAVPDYRGCADPSDRVALLCRQLAAEPPGRVVLMGSSLGGAVSIFAARQHTVAALFLLAPAVYWPGYEHLDYRCEVPSIEVVHGWRDAVVPPDRVLRWCREHRATTHLLDDGHALIDSLPEIERLFGRFLSRIDK